MKDSPLEEAKSTFSIDTELSVGNLKYLLEYVRRDYLLQRKIKAYNLQITDDGNRLHYTIAVDDRNQFLDVTVDASIPIQVTMKPSHASLPESFVKLSFEDLFLKVQMFEDVIRETTLYFAFVSGETIVPEREEASVLIRLFSDSMLPLYLVLTVFTVFAAWVFNSLAPLVIVVFSLILSLVSGKVIARTGDWQIGKDQPTIHLLQYHFSPTDFQRFRRQFGDKISSMRNEIYQATIVRGKPVDCDTAGRVFAAYGINCTPNDFTVRTVNLYDIVQKAANRFRLPIPEIVVVNNVLPNAAAAGPRAQWGTLLVTTGLMTQLEDDELLSVIGHELSHLKAHDPLVMFVVSSLEYLIRFYVFWPYLWSFGIFSYWLYSTFAIGLVYFFGKFLESRADLDSATIIGQPQIMAEALRKIAYKRLFPLYRNEPAFQGYRRTEWLRFDPHPPAYFRIAQLDSLETPHKIRHTFVTAVKENIKGFLRA